MVFLNGEAIEEPDRRGAPIVDDSFLLLFNGHFEPVTFQLPTKDFGHRWTAVLDTDSRVADGKSFRPRAKISVEQRSVVLLTRPPLVASPVASGSGAAARAAQEATRMTRVTQSRTTHQRQGS